MYRLHEEIVSVLVQYDDVLIVERRSDTWSIFDNASYVGVIRNYACFTISKVASVSNYYPKVILA